MTQIRTIGIVGYGFVGAAVGAGFSSTHEVLFHDPAKEGSRPLDEVVAASDMIFMCLPTPMDRNTGRIRLDILRGSAAEIVSILESQDRAERFPIVVKSTSLPGTTSSLQTEFVAPTFVFNPEFLRERTHIEDFLNQDRIILGADHSRRDCPGLQLVVDLYSDRFPEVPILVTDAQQAELVKYGTNSFLALKVMFANEMYELCQQLELDYNEFVRLLTLDPRITSSHLTVPGPDGKRGFGGRCFPKDLNALINFGEAHGVGFSVLRSAWKENLRVREEYDWEQIQWATLGDEDADDAPVH